MEDQKKQPVTRSYRVEDEIAEKIAKLGKEKGVSQNKVFEMLLDIYDLHEDKLKYPEASQDIDTFLSHLKSIQDAYHHIVELNAQTEERVRQDYKRRLENEERQISDLIAKNDALEEKIHDLHNSIDNWKETDRQKTKELMEYSKEITDMEKRLDDKQAIIDSLTARIPDQAEVDSKIKTMEVEISNLRSAMDEAETAKREAELKADKAVSELSALKNDIDISKEQSEKEIAALKKEHERDIDLFAKQAEADKKAAVAEARQEERDKADEKIEKLQEKIDELRSKIDEQRDIISEIKSRR